MLLKLYCSSECIPDENWKARMGWDTLQRCNVGFSGVMYLLWMLNKKGIPTEIVDVSCIPEEQIRNTYAEAISLAVSRKFRMRSVFGTKHQSGSRFGKEVPALFIHGDDQGKLIDFYPRIEEQDRIVTILDFLTQANLGLQEKKKTERR